MFTASIVCIKKQYQQFSTIVFRSRYFTIVTHYFQKGFNTLLTLKKTSRVIKILTSLQFITESSLLTLIPLTFSAALIFLTNGSDCMINKSADRASPWRIPLLILKYSDCIPLVKMLHLACLYIVSSHKINRSPKLNCFSTLNNQSHSTRSNVFPCPASK